MIPKKVGILGGTFDPVHLGHLIMANEAYHALSLDELRFMPSAVPPHKKSHLITSNDHRIKMVELAIEDIPYFKLERIEFERSGLSFTYDTINQLKIREPDIEIFFIIGGDMIDYLPQWHKIKELMNDVQFVGIRRTGSSGETDYPVHMLETPMIDLSSSFIRQRLNQNIDVTFLLPYKVFEYIKQEGLYES